MRKKGKRSKSYSGLKREADKAFSEWIRRSHADSDGMVRCVTCGRAEPWKRIQCGHFVSRVHLATRFYERNCAPQDYSCNVLRRGNASEFALWLVDSYGPGIIEELARKKRQQVKYTRSDLESIRDSYRERIRQLEVMEVLP